MMNHKMFKDKVDAGFKQIEERIDEVETNAAVLEVFSKLSRSIGEPDTEAEKQVALAQGKLRRVKQVIETERKKINK